MQRGGGNGRACNPKNKLSSCPPSSARLQKQVAMEKLRTAQKQWKLQQVRCLSP